MKKNIVAIDSGCFIAMQLDQDLAAEIKSNLKEKWDAFCSEMAILETFYVVCRRTNYEKAKKKITALIESKVIKIVPIKELIEYASKLKCERPIALADCLTIALAKKLEGKAIFYKKEMELKKTIEKDPFDVELMFLVNGDN